MDENKKQQRKEYMKKHREKNKEKIRESKKEYNEKNKETIQLKRSTFRKENKLRLSVVNKEYYENNKDDIKLYKKQYNYENKHDISLKKKLYYEENKKDFLKKSSEYYFQHKNDPEFKNKRNNQVKERKKRDVNFKISGNCRTLIYKSLVSKNITKNEKSIELMGCSKDFFMKWIEWSFDSHMNLGNYGIYWEIDHVNPVSSFDLTLKCQRLLCFNWKNCRPLQKEENQKKFNKIIEKDVENQQLKVIKYISLISSIDTIS